MSRRKLYAAVAGVVVLVVAITLGLVFGLSGGQTQGTEETQASLPSVGGPHEAIQVHGHWTIDVMNPDGTLASHQEFDNRFVGGNSLPIFLMGSRTVGDWEIFLESSSLDTSPFMSCSGEGERGGIIEPDSHLNPACNYFCTLLKQAAGTHLGLSGSATAQRNGSINRVETVVLSCAPDVLPSVCYGGNVYYFTDTGITPIIVVTGQQILVNVDINFPNP